MILDKFISQLQAELPNSVWEFVPRETPAIRFPAVSEDFGDIEVIEQGGELTVYFGRFSHSHFARYDNNISEEERAKLVASDAVSCLEDVFADRLEFYGSQSGIGGFQLRGSRTAGPTFVNGHRTYVWSGGNG